MSEENIAVLKDTIEHLGKKLAGQESQLADLIEYLGRTGVLKKTDPRSFDDWKSDLGMMRQEEKKKHEEAMARDFLERRGFLVVRNENEIDAARLKAWTESVNAIQDDDIPF